MKKITAKEFFRLCKGSKRTGIQIVDSAAHYDSTIFEFTTVDGLKIYKIETRPTTARYNNITVAFYKQIKKGDYHANT